MRGIGGDALDASTGLGRAVATIDLDALRANFAEATRLAGGRRTIGVVKADAYGHGALPVARALAGAGCPMLATWSVSEAVELREAGLRCGLLVLGGVGDDAEAEAAVAQELVAVLHDEAGRERVARAAQRAGGAAARVQIELDSGMHRMGASPADARALAAAVAAEPALELSGVMTHFARADEADLEATRDQLRRFGAWLDALRDDGIAPGSVHAANSAGLVALNELASGAPEQDAVRPGLLLYGAQPSAARRAALRPVMSLRAPVVALRAIGAGDAVGYGAEYRAKRATRIATVGLGYADGVPIAAGASGSVWLADQKLPIAGRVSMDSIGVEVGDAPVRVGDEALIFGGEGPGGAARLPVEEAAAAAGTIAYELLVRVGRRVRRDFRGGTDGV